MKILIIGNGAREHALAWKVAQSSAVKQVFVAPGNAGTAAESKVSNIAIAATDIKQLLAFAQAENIDLTLVGPEAPLAMGIVDQFCNAGFPCFGPTQAAAQLESSKVFCKNFLARHKIPTAHYASFTDLFAAQRYIQEQNFPLVIKADGLASGKGVVIAHSLAEATSTLTDMLSGNAFGTAGQRVVIEEFLKGEEISFIVVADGNQVVPLASSQDHKARDNGDTGPNTGGMGAYSPALRVDDTLHKKIMQQIIFPTLNGMIAEGMPYTGFLYAGLMITPEGEPKVLEFNCRLGDPETAPLLLRFQSDLPTLCLAALHHQLHTIHLSWDTRTALAVVLTTRDYPLHYPVGELITGMPVTKSSEWKIFHGGTRLDETHQQLITAGGRVLCVTALGESTALAQKLAYDVASNIHWDHLYYRTDIGYRAIQQELTT